MTKTKLRKVDAIEVISRGRVIARIVVGDAHQAARDRLLAARKHCRVGDLISPSGARWQAER